MELTVATHEHQFAHELRTTDAIIEKSHLHLKSGRHAEIYIDCDPLFAQSWRMRHFYMKWAGDWLHGVSSTARPEVVAGPAIGGVYLAGGFAQFLFDSNFTNIGAVWADKHGDDFALERAGFQRAVRGRRVLVVEDVITTGGSTKKTIAAVQAAGGIVIGVACMVNRTRAVTHDVLDVQRLTTCWQLDVPSYAMEDCPFCAEQRPMVTNLAHGDVFLAEFPNYAGGFTEVHIDAT